MKRYRVDYMRAEGNRGRTGTIDAQDDEHALRKAYADLCITGEYVYQIARIGKDREELIWDYFNGFYYKKDYR
jgi:hypothetical protein